MIEGIRCPPATHTYVVHGKVLFCTACADVQALLLELADVPRQTLGAPPEDPVWPIDLDRPPQTIPESDEAQMDALRALRDLVSKGGTPSPEQLDLLGQRHEYEGDLSELEVIDQSNNRQWPRVPVTEGYNGSAADDRLPDAGL